MNFCRYEWDKVCVEVSSFGRDLHVEEIHAILHVDGSLSLTEQWAALCEGEERLIALLGGAQTALRRWFCADVRAVRALAGRPAPGATSFVGQPPLDGSDIALWIYLLRGQDVLVETNDGTAAFSHEGRQHIWDMDIHSPGGDSAVQTSRILENFENLLAHRGATIAEDCVRTWFFVDDIDRNYSGVVTARRENFELQGLTSDTHYIASTGICGGSAPKDASVQFGAYSILGLEGGQQRYLYAPSHLNPTYEYGVTFERGTRIEYGDRIHSIISGTASIDNRGEVVHVGDIAGQTYRMLENIEALLEESGACMNDIMHLLVYLRRASDYEIVSTIFEEKLPGIPTVFTLAPVCRPTWLIETECVAVTPCASSYRPF